MIIKFIHKQDNQFKNKRYWVSVPFKQNDNEVGFSFQQ